MSKGPGTTEPVPESPIRKRRVMVGAIGACVHNLGVEGFAQWMEDKGIGYQAVKLGPAVPIDDLINKIREARPEVVGISMRLGDLHVDKIVGEFIEKATRHSQPMLVKNRDYRQDHLDLQILVRATPATGYRYLSVSSAGSPAVFSSGINEAGLAVVDTHVPSRDLGPGLPRYALMRELMEQHATVPTALEYLKSAPRTGDGNLVLADASGNLAAFEVGHRAYGIVEAPAGWVVATNHFVTPEMEAYYVPEGQRHLRGSSRRRRAVVEEALQAARGQVDVAWARQLMARHGGPLDALCRHKNLERGRATISTSIFLPADRQLLFCHGQPCQAEYHAFRISQT